MASAAFTSYTYQNATDASPLTLKPDSAQWWAPYYDPNTIKYRDRVLFAGA